MALVLPTHRWRDGLLAVALAAGAAAQLALGPGRGMVAGYLWVALTTLPLALRHRAPVAVGLGVQLAFALGTPSVEVPELLAQGVSAFLVATYVAALGPRSWAGSAAVGGASLALVSLQGVLDTRYGTAGAVVANAVYVAMSWAVAAAVRLQVERSERSVRWAEDAVRTSQEHAQQAVLDERARLARELHDVLGHSISVMVLRARGGVHENAVDPAKGTEALRDIATVGSRALADVRVLLELDQGAGPDAGDPDRLPVGSGQHHPLPGVDDIAELVASTRAAGLQVDLEVRGRPRPLSDGLGLTAYRVTQEALTNVLRHSRSPTALVVLTWGADELVVEVDDDGPGDPGPDSGGRGLIGMGDRIALVGGRLLAGARPDGGFRVRAHLPLAVP